MKKRSRLLGFVFVVSAASALQGAPAEALSARLQAIQAQYEIVGLSAAVVKNGEVAWHGTFGMSDLARELPVTGETKYRIASISKTATAVALMQLWERQKFQLDDDISETFGYPVVNPAFPDTPITFRHLLTHTSSLRDGANYNRFLRTTYSGGENAPDLREILHVDGEFYDDGAQFTDSEPGTTYRYCNLNFGVIGTLVEKLANERFDVYCRKNIFEPLGISASFNPADIADVNHLAVLYRHGDDGWAPQFDNHLGEAAASSAGPAYRPGQNAVVFSPQGGLRAGALDLAVFMRQFMGDLPEDAPGILKQSTIDLMLDRHWHGRGLGFARRNLVADEIWVGHGGSAHGLGSRMYFQPAGGSGFVVITSGARPGPPMTDLEEAILEFFETPDTGPASAEPDGN